MPTLKEVRRSVKDTIEAVPAIGLNVYERVPASVTVPAVLVVPAEGDFLLVHGNAATGWEFNLVVLVPSGDEDAAQDTLDDYVDAHGDKSLVAAIHANPSLGRSDCSATVRGLSNYGIKYEVASTPYIGATLRLSVVATHR